MRSPRLQAPVLCRVHLSRVWSVCAARAHEASQRVRSSCSWRCSEACKWWEPNAFVHLRVRSHSLKAKSKLMSSLTQVWYQAFHRLLEYPGTPGDVVE